MPLTEQEISTDYLLKLIEETHENGMLVDQATWRHYLRWALMQIQDLEEANAYMRAMSETRVKKPKQHPRP